MTNKWILYLKERFPAIPLFVFTLLVSISAEKYISNIISFKSLISGLIFLSFFLHLRLLDEFKDFEFDSNFHKDRPIQTGLIKLTDIKTLLFTNLLLMIFVSILTKYPLLFALSLAYTLLMFKDFFVKNFFTKSPILYLISHEIVFLLMYLYLFTFLSGKIYLSANLNEFLLFAYLLIPVIIIEIGRKMNHRYDHIGNKTTDTYSHIWGDFNTITVFFSLVAINVVALSIIKNRLSIIILLIPCIIITILSLNNQFRNKIMQNHMKLTTLFALVFPLLLLVI